MIKFQISLFAEQELEDRRTKLGNPLARLANHVSFKGLAAYMMSLDRVLRAPKSAIRHTRQS